MKTATALINGCLSALLFGLLLATPLRAADPGAVRAQALRPGEVMVLDGTLAHPAWQRAAAHERFIEKDPTNGGAPPQETRFQVLFDERALYVGVTVLDTDPARIRDPQAGIPDEMPAKAPLDSRVNAQGAPFIFEPSNLKLLTGSFRDKKLRCT